MSFPNPSLIIAFEALLVMVIKALLTGLAFLGVLKIVVDLGVHLKERFRVAKKRE
jgi:hypothetical protein